MYSVVVAAHPGVVMANHPLAVKMPSETHVLQARHTHRGFRAFSRKFQQPNHPQYLQLIQGGHSRAEPLFCVSQGNAGDNCFGEVVDDEMLKNLGSEEKSQENRARQALLLMNHDEKKAQASRYVANLKDQYGYGASTLCLVYNATGHSLRHSTHKNWYGGSLFKQQGYPSPIHNGQWAAFLHVHGKEEGKPPASAGAVVYQIIGDKRQDILLAWYTDPLPLKQPYKQANKAYYEIAPVNTYLDDDARLENILKDKILANVPSSASDTSADGVEVEVHTEQGTNSPTFTAIIKHKM